MKQIILNYVKLTRLFLFITCIKMILYDLNTIYKKNIFNFNPI
jgi:hypothetical protein